MVERKTGILSPKGALEAKLGRKRNKHPRCVEVAAITRYQSSRRQQRVPGVVTFTYFDEMSASCKQPKFKSLPSRLTLIISVFYEQSVRPF